jgi:four helix bundle protein
MNEQAEELKDRTRKFAIDVLLFARGIPDTDEGRIIGRQLIRAGTGVGANYRAVCRSRSRAEFIAKIGVALEEADESAFWLEVISAISRFPNLLHCALHQLLRVFQLLEHKRDIHFGFAREPFAAAIDTVLPDERQRIGQEIERNRQAAARLAHHRFVVFERAAVFGKDGHSFGSG